VQLQKDGALMATLKVSAIKSRAMRRVVIVATYPFAVLWCLVFPFWNLLVDLCMWQVELARTAAKQWRES
jgi:hypothetical protein